MRAFILLPLLYGLALLGFLSWRASLPNNRDQAGLDFLTVETNGSEHFLAKDTHLYDDALTRVTARNFIQDGLAPTRGLPNRRGAPRVSLYDPTHTQCEALAAEPTPLLEWNGFGQPVSNAAATNDCVHIHYPPLADWIFAGLARCGLARVLHYKLLAVLLNVVTFALLYCWLTREVRPLAAFLGTALGTTLPAFLSWADALYFHPFQYLFLSAGTLAFSEYLLGRRRRWLVVAGCFFLCESLVSYQLVLFFAIVIVGLRQLEPATSRAPLKSLAALAAAPLLGSLLPLALAVSLLGARRVARNLTSTLFDRVQHGAPGGFRGLVAELDASSPGLLLLLGLLALTSSGLASAMPVRRPLALLGIFFLGGLSFLLVFPGTAQWHGASLHRLFLPFVVVLLAFVAEAGCASLATWRVARERRGRMLAGLSALLAVASLGWAVRNGARQARRELAWNLLRNLRPAPNNLALQSLDVLYWTAGVPRSRGLLLMPVSGLRTHEPPAWLADLRMLGPEPVHYELWWLDAEPLMTIQVLLDRRQAEQAVAHCGLQLLKDRQFQDIASRASVSLLDFTPSRGEREPREAYAWLRFSLPVPQASRALRFSCWGLDSIALHQLEAFASVPGAP